VLAKPEEEEAAKQKGFEGVAARAEEGTKLKSGGIEGMKKVLAKPDEEEAAKQKDGTKQAIKTAFPNKRVLEQVHNEGWGKGMWLVREAWRRR
jgi:hypothetical protein